MSVTPPRTVDEALRSFSVPPTSLSKELYTFCEDIWSTTRLVKGSLTEDWRVVAADRIIQTLEIDVQGRAVLRMREKGRDTNR